LYNILVKKIKKKFKNRKELPTMTEKKVTKRDNFATIIEVLANAGRQDLADVIAHEIELLDAKAAKAKEKAAEKKAQNDDLGDAVAAVLTDELTCIADITAKIVGDDVTVARVTNRLSKLVANGVAVKEQITVPGGEGSKSRKIMAYKLA
jgi:uncharacterized protein YqeY